MNRSDQKTFSTPSLSSGLDRRRFLAGFGLGSVMVAGWDATRSSAAALGDATPTARPLLDDDSSTFYREGWATDFSIHNVPLDEIRSGGPGKDGIPPIDNPQFVAIAEADEWIDDREPVIVVAIDTEAGPVTRAYPLQIMIWHEIVNDELGGIPILVTFCPLCNTAIAFDRRLDGSDTVYDFGTTGNLRHSDLVMWDRQTESWWQQITGEAIVGELTGNRLRVIPAQILGWETFKQEFPEGEVLSRETGFDRTYGRNPYPGYDDVDSFPFLFDSGNDDRLPAMQRVAGVDGVTEQAAYVEEALREKRVVNDTLAGSEIVLFWKEGAAAATDQIGYRRFARCRSVRRLSPHPRWTDTDLRSHRRWALP